jgi:hypothetical protein
MVVIDVICISSIIVVVTLAHSSVIWEMMAKSVLALS